MSEFRRKIMMFTRPTPPPYDSKVEYLTSSGTQYIDTGIYGKLATEIRTKIYVTANGQLFGDITTSSKAVTSNFSSSSSSVTRFGNKSASGVYKNCSMSEEHEIVMNKDGVWIDDTKVGSFSGVSSFTTPNSMFLFRCRNSSLYPSMRVYRFTIYESGTKVLDLIPVRVGQVGKMYDTVNGGLYANAGSGSFTYGNDV